MFGLNISFRAFCEWWGSELASMIPERVHALFTPKAVLVGIQRDGNELVVGRRDRSANGAIRLDTSGVDDSGERDMARRAIATQRRGNEPVSYILSPEDAIRNTIKLPAVAAENLRDVLGYDMDGRTPFRADEVYYDFKIIGTDAEHSQIEVDLAVAPRSVVDRAVEKVKTWGVSPVSVTLADSWDHPERDFVFLEDTASRGQLRLGGFAVMILFLTAITLAAALVHIRLNHLKTEAGLLANRVALLKKEADTAIQLRKEIDALDQQRSFSHDKKKSQFPVVVVLNDLTKLIPDDSWIIQFQIKDNTAQIQGYSPDASKLVELIERSPRFRNAEFRSRVTRDARSGAQRFHIAFQIVPEG